MISTGSLVYSHLLPILFIYGLSYFCLGLVVFVQNTSRSGLELRRFIWLFAAFGLLHGMSEWSDMFLTLDENYWSAPVFAAIRITGFFMALGSFVLLLDLRRPPCLVEKTAMCASAHCGSTSIWRGCCVRSPLRNPGNR
jgi:hypothetical protein